MEYFIYLISIYLIVGFGFALSSWLQAAENDVKNKRKPSKFIFSKPFLFFLIGWLFIAIYCYRAEVKRTIPTHHYFSDLDK